MLDLSLLKHTCKCVLLFLGVYRCIRWLFPRSELAVLRYHAVCHPDAAYASPGICVTPEGFRKHVQYISKSYPVLPLDDAVELLKCGKSLPSNVISITFDDGYEDNYNAFKILKKCGVSAKFFITTNCIDDKEIFWVSEVYYLLCKTKIKDIIINIKNEKHQFKLNTDNERKESVSRLTRLIKSCTIFERESIRKEIRLALHDVVSICENSPLMLSSEQITEMIQGGMSMGGHTLTHCNLPSAGIKDARHELTQCRLDLEKKFNIQVNAFAYPNGGAVAYVTKDVQALAQDAGYTSAWTSEHGFVNAQTDFWRAPRLVASESLAEMIHLLEGDRLGDMIKKWIQKYVSARRTPRNH